jgi:formylglycine-generating enzyme required for sulfatase activity
MSCRHLLALFGCILPLGHASAQGPAQSAVNSVGMKLILLPAGSFTMGSSGSEKGSGDDEITHKVTFSRPLFIGVHVVTQEQWQVVMGENPSHFKSAKDLPVESVSWHDCQAFCKKLSEKEKKPYRLPTEAEWEYACRAGTTTPYHFGATLAVEQANYNGNFVYGPGKTGSFREKTMPVGSFPANAFGLHDMHGNVWQWCQDWHGGYARGDAADPQGPKTGTTRIQRGGSWSSHPIFCRSANRNFADPASRTEYAGLRVCFTPD